MSKTKPLFILSGALALALPAFADEPTKEQLDFFEGKIRPLLTEKCYKCHSQESGKSKGGLTLDLAAATLKGGDTGPGVVPGKPEESLIYKAIIYTDKDLAMPPSSSGGKLDAQQIADVTTWIKMGAPDPRKDGAKAKKLSGLNDSARKHWAYLPIKDWKRVKVPINKNQQWCSTPIDAFILQKLQANGMLPSPDASRETLLRRAYYDLIGLPPSPTEIVAFLSDRSPNAWEKVIDGLLASPHYGERWARYWLNSARYADTIGGDANVNNGRLDYRYPNAWTYRDYVVRAFNEDKPYNQFIIEQLAADQLYPVKPVSTLAQAETKPAAPKATLALKTAGAKRADPLLLSKGKTGAASTTVAQVPATSAQPTAAADPAMMTADYMMGGGRGKRSTGVEMEGNPNLAALGFLTVGMRFNNVNDTIDDRINVFSKAFLGLTVACARCHDHMFDPIPQADYYALHGVFANSEEPIDKPLIAEPSPGLRADYDSKLAAVMKENRDIYYREVEHWLDMLQGKSSDYLQAALLNGKRSEKNLQARQALIAKAGLDTPFTNFFQRVMNQNNPVFGPLRKFEDLGESDIASRAPALLKEIEKSGRYNPLVVEALVKADPHSMHEVLAAYEGLYKRFAAKSKGFVPAFKDATTDTVSGYTPDEIQFLSGPFAMAPAPKATSEWIRESIGTWNVQMTGRARFVFAKVNDLELTHPGAPTRAMVMVDKPNPQNSRLFIRGQAGTPGDTVPRGFLTILSPDGKRQQFTSGSGRLELARAIANKDNPLTPRVLVNRVWLEHFGEGFVRTPDDLGVMSEKPTHPELLDYLASWFVDEKGANWSVKKLHKFIMLSRVYQESSHTIPDYEVKEPDNRLLWRANVRRLDFESFRDSLLAMSGRLDPKIGGQPVNITEEPYSYRRSIYGYIDRGNVPELMQAFDFSDPDMPNSKRTTSIVPQQALFLMNSPMAVDVARRVIARSEFQRADNDLRRVFALYRIMFQRQPGPREIEIGINFVQKEKSNQAEVDAKAPEIAKKNVEIQKRVDDLKKRDNDAKRAVQNEGEIIERKPLKPWEAYAHALLFANEAIYVN
ncbi:MAG: PSD1 and planctomycete cytochrome C domain-containing protein [Chthoniobacteraceae bacterium]